MLLAFALGGRALSDRIRARRARPGAAPRARCRDARDGARDGAGLRRALPDGDRQPPPGHGRQPHQVDRGLGPCQARARRPARAFPLRLGDAEGRHGRRVREDAAGGRKSTLPKLGEAPDFTGNQRWFNTPGGKALTLGGLRGRVVLVDFWTYTCINCIRTLPELRAWDARYRNAGLTIVGVHSPEFDFEKNAGNVAAAIRQNHLRYPVAQDNELATWNAWGNQYWPASYLIDSRGEVRYVHFGEGDAEKTEAAIRSLLAERSGRALGARARPRPQLRPGAPGDTGDLPRDRARSRLHGGRSAA